MLEVQKNILGCPRAVVWWKCKKGHRWKAAISDRNRGNSCPKCAEERRVSFPEKAVLYYVEKVFTDVKANYKPGMARIAGIRYLYT